MCFCVVQIHIFPSLYHHSVTIVLYCCFSLKVRWILFQKFVFKNFKIPIIKIGMLTSRKMLPSL